jgi:hypothetical protein
MAVQIAVRDIDLVLWKTRNFIFLVAILAMNYTLSRPSPVDMLFVLAGVLCIVVNQPVRLNFVVFLLFVLSFTLSFFYASVPHLTETNIIFPGEAPEKGSVPFELLAKTFAISIGLIGCYVATSWKERNYETFIKFYVASTTIAAILGIIGFVGKIDLLTWDDRAKGLLDDPNMYGSFLIPGILGCVYLINQRIGKRWLVAAALSILAIGIMLSFSRAATVGLLLCLFGYLFFLNRFSLGRFSAILLAVAFVGVVLVFAGDLISADFSQKLFQRLTVAESYDLGREGRYGRYLLVLPMILDNPAGLGVLQLQKIFPEPIHNMYLSSFINYGWTGGFTWLTLFGTSIWLSIENYRRTRSPMAVLLMVCFLSQAMCIALHEGEHWRHLWLFMGLLWGFSRRNFTVPAAVKEASVPPPAVKVFAVPGIARAGRA